MPVGPVAVHPVAVDGGSASVRARRYGRGRRSRAASSACSWASRSPLGAVEQRRLHVRRRGSGGLRLVRLGAAATSRARQVRWRSFGHASCRRRRLAEERDVVRPAGGRSRGRDIAGHRGGARIGRRGGPAARRDRPARWASRTTTRRAASPCGPSDGSRLGDRTVPRPAGGCASVRPVSAPKRSGSRRARRSPAPVDRRRLLGRRCGAAGRELVARRGCVRSARPLLDGAVRGGRPEHVERLGGSAGRRAGAAARPGASPIHRTASRPPTPAARRPAGSGVRRGCARTRRHAAVTGRVVPDG